MRSCPRSGCPFTAAALPCAGGTARATREAARRTCSSSSAATSPLFSLPHLLRRLRRDDTLALVVAQADLPFSVHLHPPVRRAAGAAAGRTGDPAAPAIGIGPPRPRRRPSCRVPLPPQWRRSAWISTGTKGPASFSARRRTVDRFSLDARRLARFRECLRDGDSDGAVAAVRAISRQRGAEGRRNVESVRDAFARLHARHPGGGRRGRAWRKIKECATLGELTESTVMRIEAVVAPVRARRGTSLAKLPPDAAATSAPLCAIRT